MVFRLRSFQRATLVDITTLSDYYILNQSYLDHQGILVIWTSIESKLIGILRSP
jgi:hypothetical protein